MMKVTICVNKCFNFEDLILLFNDKKTNTFLKNESINWLLIIINSK